MPSQTSRDDLALFTTLATNKHKELQLPPETLRSEILRMFLSNLGCEISPVCAFLGGQLAQDAINVIGGKEQPIQNMLIFDGEDLKAPIYTLTSDLMLNMQNTAPLPQMPIIGNGADMAMMAAPLDPMAAGVAPIADPTMPPASDPTAPQNGFTGP
jgi:ubiquitin-like 1-activating enzyme E1 A